MLWTVTRRVLEASIAGLAAGSIAAIALANTLKGLLYGVAATDAWSFVSAGAALLAVTAIAAVVPAIHATRINPVDVLRAD